MVRSIKIGVYYLLAGLLGFLSLIFGFPLIFVNPFLGSLVMSVFAGGGFLLALIGCHKAKQEGVEAFDKCPIFLGFLLFIALIVLWATAV